MATGNASYAPQKVMNGSFASMWIDSDFIGEGTELEAKVSLEKKEVKQAGTLAKGYKIVGSDGKGKLKVNKISSYFIDKLAEPMQKGTTKTFSIQSKIKDPDLDGKEETVKLTGVIFDELPLINWKTKELLEEELSFTFSGFEILDTVDRAAQKDNIT